MAASRQRAVLALVSVLLVISAAPGANAAMVDAVQYYHQAFEHYFVAVSQGEVAALDQGRVAGWWRTGARYRVDDAPGPGLQPVCRFYTERFAARGSHFFTADAVECESLKANRTWTYEGIAFHARAADAAGACEDGTAPVHRLYNNAMTGAPNHVYVVDAAHRATLLRAGWVAEGVAYCVAVSTDDPAARTAVLAGTNWMLPSGDVPEGQFPVQFAPALSLDGSARTWFAGFGMEAPAAALYVTNRFNVWRGYAGFVPASGKTILTAASGFEPEHIQGDAWELDDAAATQSEVCSMVVYRNVATRDRNGHIASLHPYQPYLWSGCRRGVAVRVS